MADFKLRAGALRLNILASAAYAASVASAAPPPPPPAPAAPNLNRLTSTTLFVDVKASTALTGGDFGGAIVIPAKAGVAAPKDDLIVGVYGPHNDYVDIYARWAWRNQGGDWIDANGTWQGTAAPHFTFTANSVTSGSAAYTGVVCTEAAKAAWWRGKWNAFIVKCTGGQRAVAALHHPTLAAPVMRVTYTDTSTANLACLACVRLAGGSAYTHIGAQQAIISASLALEFEMPTKEVASATIDFVVSSHDASPATINGYTVNPPTAAGSEEFGIAENYNEDVGLGSHPSVLFHQRYTDGTVLADYVIQSPSGVDPGDFNNWSPYVYGGSDDPTKLPTAIGGAQVAGSNKWFQVNGPSAGGGFSVVDSSYTGEGFTPFGPGRGALRIVLPAATVADGGAIGNYSSVLGCDLRYFFDKAICGKLDEIWVRQSVQLAWAPRTAAAMKMLREVDGGSARYAIPKGKFGVGPHHAGPYGGNSNTGGNNLGHSERLGFESLTDDFTNPATYLFEHTQDMLPDRDNEAFGGNGLGAGFFVGQKYVIENRVKLNTYDAAGAIGSSPADGEIETWINGVNAGKVTGLKYRDGAINYTTTPNGPTYIAPFGDLGFTGLWLNNFSGGTLPPDVDLVMFIGDVCAATEYIGRAAPAMPSWVPAPGEVAVMSTANGLVTGHFRNQVAPYYLDYYSSDIVSNYSGGVVNNHRGVYGTVINEGSGHGGSNDSSLIELVPTAAGLVYSRVNDPTPLFGSGTDLTSRSNNATGDPTTAGLVDKVKGLYTVDGQPISRHSYGAQTVVAPHHTGGASHGAFVRTLWNGGTYQYLAAGGEAPFRVDMTTASGTASYRKAGTPRIAGDFADVPFPYVSAPMWQAHVPKQNRIYLEAHGGDINPRWFDLMLGKYFSGTGTPLDNRVQGNGSRLLTIPWRDLVLMVDKNAGGHVQIRSMDVSALDPSWNNTPKTLSTTLSVTDDWSSVTVDIRRKCLLVGDVIGDSSGVHRIDIPTTLTDPWVVTREPFGAGQTIDWSNMVGQVYGRFDGVEKLRGTRLLMTRASKDATGDTNVVEKVFAFRPTSGYPSWRPAAGDAVQIGYAQGAHPTGGLAATLYDKRPAIQSWNPGTEPWKTSNNYDFATIPGYCGGSWVQSLRKWVGFGGGHASYNVPALYAFDVPSLSWDWLHAPLPTDGFSSIAGGMGGSAAADRAILAAAYTNGEFDAAGEFWWDGSSSTWGANAQPGKFFPEPAHTYYGMVWVPGSSVGNINGIILKCTNSTGRQPGCAVPTRHYYDLDDNLWKLTTNFRSNYDVAAGGSIYFGGSIDRVFSCTSTSGGSFPGVLDVFNPATKTWSTTPISGSSLVLQIYGGGFIAHLPTSLLIACCPATSQVSSITYVNANQHQFWACDAAAAKAGTAVTFSKLTISNPGGTWPVRPAYGSNECGQVTWTLCPINGCFYAINGNHNSTTLWKLSPPAGATTAAAGLSGTWTITTETLAHGVPCGATGGPTGVAIQSGGTGVPDPMNRLVWDDVAGCFLWFDMWVRSRPVAIRPLGV